MALQPLGIAGIGDGVEVLQVLGEVGARIDAQVVGFGMVKVAIEQDIKSSWDCGIVGAWIDRQLLKSWKRLSGKVMRIVVTRVFTCMVT